MLSDENPRKAAYFGLNAVAHSIVCLLDGRHDVEDIRRTIHDAHGVDCSGEQIDSLLHVLEENGLIEGSPPGSQKPTPVPDQQRVIRLLGRVVQTWFLFKADRPLARLDTLIRRMARPAVFYGWVLSGFLGLIGVLAFRRQELAYVLGGLRGATRPVLLGLLAGTYFAKLFIGICHEFAHGAVCRYFGGRGIKMGAGLYYLAPVFVCDTSSTWLIEKKRNRILVSLAGPLCQMGFGACGAFLFMLPLPYTVRVAAVILMAVGYGENLLTDFNPLLRYDGYYILADLLELPNLRARSFAYLGQLFRHRKRPLPSTQDRTVCLVYGTLAFAYTFFVLCGIAMMFVSLARKGAVLHSLLLCLGPVLVISLFLLRRRAGRVGHP